MNKRRFMFIGIMLTACMLFAGGHKEAPNSWYQNYTAEEKKLIEKYEIQNQDLSGFRHTSQLLDDIADINLYGNTMEDIHTLDRAGYMRDAYDDPMHVVDYYDSYVNSLTFGEISKKWGISGEAYNNWILNNVWNSSLKQATELKDAAASKLYTDFALKDISSIDQINAVNVFAGFTDKLQANRNGLVGETFVMDVLTFAEHVLEGTDKPVFNAEELYGMMKERLNDDIAAINAKKISVDAENKAIIDEFKTNLRVYSDVLYREHWFDETYVSYYLQPKHIVKPVSVRDWTLGVGANIGYGFSGVTLSTYLKNFGINCFVGNHNFENNFMFGLGVDYNWHFKKGHHLGIGVDVMMGFDFELHYTYHYDDHFGSHLEMDNSGPRFMMYMDVPISYKYFFQKTPLMLSVTSAPTIAMGGVSDDEPMIAGSVTVGMQYLIF